MIATDEPLSWQRLLLQKRMLIVLLLGFSSGLPLGLTGTTLQAWFAKEDVSIITIGFLALVGQPYVYKFLWAPGIDKIQLPWLGLRRGWMIATQSVLMLLLIFIQGFSPTSSPWMIGIIALFIAVFSATQDIVVDAFRTEVLLPEERGAGSAMFVAGYRIAMIASTGLALVMAEYIGFKNVYLCMAALMGVGIIVTLWAKEPTHQFKPAQSIVSAYIEPLKEFLSRKNAILFLLLIVLYKLGDAFANTLTTTFLIRELGFRLETVGMVNKVMGLLATILGAFIGGVLMARIGLYRSLLWFGFLQAITNFLYMILAWMGANFWMMAFSVFIENLAGGMGTAAFLALLMSLCNTQYTATQYALLSALSAIGRVFVGPTAGYLVNWLGWAEFFFWTAVFAVPGLVLLVLLKHSIHLQDKNIETPLVEDAA